MSNFFATFGLKNFPSPFENEKKTAKIEKDGATIFVKLSQETTFFHKKTANETWNWVVCGIGYSDNFKFLDEKSWNTVLQSGEEKKLSGHFAIIKWNNNNIELIRDILEFRRIYFLSQDNTIYISTRLDLLVKQLEKKTIDMYVFSGFWHLTNSFSKKSLFKEIERTKAFKTVIDRKDFSIITEKNEFGKRFFSLFLLKKIVNLPHLNGKKTLIALSGGIDSRTVVSLYNNDFELFTFGNSDLADVKIAKKVAITLDKNLHYRHNFIPQNSSELDKAIGIIKKITLLTEMTFTIFDLTNLIALQNFNKRGFWLVDGGLGGFLRFGFGKRLYYFGRKDYQNGNYEKLLPLFIHPRNKIFTEDIQNRIEQEAKRQFFDAISSLQKEIPFERTVVELMLNYRYTNYPTNSFSLFDETIPSLMPLAEKYTLEMILTLPQKLLKNSVLNDLIIKRYKRELSHIPLVHYDKYYPYFALKNPFLIKLFETFSPKTSLDQIADRKKLILSLKEYLNDRINSIQIHNFGYYNIKLIKSELEKLNKNKPFDETLFADWLIFDFWRELGADFV